MNCPREHSEARTLGLLLDIQSALLADKPDLGAILLRLRLLAARLGSERLEDWVKHEGEGYPRGVDVPDYRRVAVTYRGVFVGLHHMLPDAQIPTALIGKYAGEQWTTHSVTESISVVQGMAENDDGLGLDASNLSMLLHNKVFKGMNCNGVTGFISSFAIRGIIQSVRYRVLDFTIELERRLPESKDISLQDSIEKTAEKTEKVDRVFNQIVYGDVNNFTAVGGSQISLQIMKGDVNSLKGELVKAGLPATDAEEITAIIADEKPSDADQPFGKKASEWIAKKTSKAAGGIWKVGSTVATEVLKEAALRYWGLK